ncbi:unnamed protein product, partial [Prorocentrum cordatum]
EAGLSLTELALRWARQRPGVTSALLGQSSLAQLEQGLAVYRAGGTLPDRLMWKNRPRAHAEPAPHRLFLGPRGGRLVRARRDRRGHPL